MSEQLDILGGFAKIPAGRGIGLTDRQVFALATIGRLQPVAGDELGAYLHQYRLEHGGKGHGADHRCDFCASEGRDMGEALKRKGLVVYKRTVGWCLPDWKPADDRPGPNATGEGLDDRGLPEGF